MGEIERLREKARHDEAQALYHARREGKIEGISERNIEIAHNLINMGLPLEQISRATGLTVEELEKHVALS